MVSELITMAGSALRRPDELNLSGNISQNWKRFKQEFSIYLSATGLEEKSGKRQAMTFLNLLGASALQVFNTFTFTNNILCPSGILSHRVTQQPTVYLPSVVM